MNQTRTWAVALPLLLTLLSLAGCTGNNEPTAFEVPYPQIGDRYRYEGSDGSRLDVFLQENGHRMDAFGVQQDVQVLNFTFTAPEEGELFHFEEAVDAEGRIIQQVAVCGLALGEAAGSRRFVCYDERAALIYGGSGLPGGLGMAPLWGHNTGALPKSTYTTLKGHVLDGNITATSQNGCLNAHGGTVDPVALHEVRPLPWVVVGTSRVLCPETPFPSLWQPELKAHPIYQRLSDFNDPTSKPPIYRLTEIDSMQPEVRGSGNRTLDLPKPQPWGAPYYVGPSQRFNFSTEEAYTAAMEGDTKFADLVAGGAIMQLAEHTRKSSGGGDIVGLTDFNTEVVTLAVIGNDGVGRSVEVTRSKTTAVGEDRFEYKLKASPIQQKSAPTLIPLQVHPEDAIAVGEAFAGLSLGFFEWVGYSSRLFGLNHFWSDVPAETILTSGYEVYVRFDDPKPESGAMVAPYNLYMDGPTGALTYMDVPRTMLPI